MAKKAYEESNIQAIATSIREKTGTETTYKTSEMPSGIAEVYEAGKQAEYDAFWDMFQLNGNRTNYNYAFAGANFDVEVLKPKYYPIVPKNASCMFMGNTRGYPGLKDFSEICKKIDFSQITNAANLFQNVCGKNITVDLSSCTSATNAFNCPSSGRIDNLTLKVTDKLTSANSMFLYNTDLVTLTFTEDSVIAVSLTLQRCVNLSHDSLMSVINALKDYSGTDTWKSIMLGEGNLAKLTEEEKQIMVSKQWNYS